MKLGQIRTMFQPVQPKRFYLVYARRSSETEDKQMASIPSQLQISKQLAEANDLPVLKVFSESKSAKQPDRAVFNEMVALIKERDDIKGIICWKLNRLSRNPLDSGRLQWLVQSGKIEEIVTPNKTYREADSDFIMSIESAQANRFIRDLRDDTIRGLNAKLEKQQFPGLAPVGYKNNTNKLQGERDISPHPVYFSLVRKIFDLALTGNFSMSQLAEKAQDLGIKSHRGNILSKTQVYRIFTNPFFTGRFVYKGQLYQGCHKRMLTDEEFDLLQDILGFNSRPRQQAHDFPLTGVMRCGECGMMVTAEKHTKHYKNGTSQKFSYYRCSKKSRTKKCSQSYIPTSELEKQALKFLKTIELSPFFVEWMVKWLNQEKDQEKQVREVSLKALKKDYERTRKKLSNLLDLKISPKNIDGSLLSDGEFQEEKNRLMIEKSTLVEKINNFDKAMDEVDELTAKTFDFAVTARKRFKKGSPEDKKIVLKAVGSNLTLKDKKLKIQPRKPFLLIKKGLVSIKTSKAVARTSKKVGTKAKYGEVFDVPTQMGPLCNDVRTYYIVAPTQEKEEIRQAFAYAG